MANIKLMKLAGLLTESKTKLKEAISKPFGTIPRIHSWYCFSPIRIDDILNNPSSFDISKDYRSIGMEKRPSVLSSDDLEAALADCDRNIKLATTILNIAKKAKEQIEGLSSDASAISAGEKEYEGVQITPQNVLDFLKSIIIDDKDNTKRIYQMYNDFVKGYYDNAKDIRELTLTSPSDLIGRGRVRGKDDVIFELKRQSGGELSEWAIENSILKFFKEEYPEIGDLLLIQRKTWSALHKKYFTIRVRRSAMASNAAINRSWKRIFIKYAEWIPE